MSVIKYKDFSFVTLEFRRRDDGEVCLTLDGTEYRTGYKMRIMRVKRFIDDWNSDIDKGRNPIDQMAKSKGASLFTGGESIKLDGKTDQKGSKKDK